MECVCVCVAEECFHKSNVCFGIHDSSINAFFCLRLCNQCANKSKFNCAGMCVCMCVCVCLCMHVHAWRYPYLFFCYLPSFTSHHCTVCQSVKKKLSLNNRVTVHRLSFLSAPVRGRLQPVSADTCPWAIQVPLTAVPSMESGGWMCLWVFSMGARGPRQKKGLGSERVPVDADR